MEKLTIRGRLDAGEVLLGFCLMYPAPGIVERCGPDWDWIWVDGQHGELGYADVLGAVRACDLARRPALVRVPAHEAGSISLALDTGAAGVIVPCVDTPEEARAVVDAAKFPPLGKRSYGGRRPIDLYGRSYADAANTELLLVCQIESPLALENAEAIAAVSGVDALFLGPDDVMLRRGYGMMTPRTAEVLGPDMRTVISACKRAGKFGCMVGSSPEMLELCLGMGFQLIAAGGDVSMLATASRELSGQARAAVKRHRPSS